MKEKNNKKRLNSTVFKKTMYKTKDKKKDNFVDTKLLLSISLETMTKILSLINTKVPRLLLIQKGKKKNT